MKERIIWLFSFSLLIIGCAVPKIVVKQNVTSQSADFVPQQLTKTIDNELQVMVEPMDASKLDMHAFLCSQLDGNFFFEHSENRMIRYYNVFDHLEFDEQMKSRRMQTSGLLDLKVQNQQLDESVAELIKLKIRGKSSIGEDGLPGSKENRWSIGRKTNPYFFEGAYLNIFRLTVENKSTKNQTLSRSKILVQNGTEQLYTFSSDELSKDVFKFLPRELLRRNLHRLNIPEQLVIPSGQKVVKFAAIPAIQLGEPLSFQYIVGDSVVQYDFEMKLDKRTIEGEYQEFEFHSKVPLYDHEDRFYSVLTTSTDTMILRGNKFYYPVDKLSDEFSVYSIQGVESGFQFGKLEAARFSDFPNGKVKVPFEKYVEYIK